IFMIPSSLLIFDHRLRTLKIVANAFLDDGPLDKLYARASESIHAIICRLTKPADLPLVQPADCEIQPAHSNFHPEEFMRAVEQAKEYIRAGDIFHAVLSQRFDCSVRRDPLDS